MIRFIDGTEFQTEQIMGMQYDMLGFRRPALSIKISGSTYAAVSEKFVTGAQFSVVDFKTVSQIKDVVVGTDSETGENIIEQQEVKVVKEDVFEKFTFVLIGDVVIHPDGLITVIVGEKTESEIKTETLESAVDELLLKQLGV